jgi:hypothetical protein
MRLPVPSVLLACTALAAGCGSSSTTTTTTVGSVTATAPAVSTAATATTPKTSPAPQTSTAPSTGSDNAAVQQYLATCKAISKRDSSLSATVKAKIESVCDKASHGDVAAAKAAAREVCVEVINAEAVPAGPLKEKAVAACNASH